MPGRRNGWGSPIWSDLELKVLKFRLDLLAKDQWSSFSYVKTNKVKISKKWQIKNLTTNTYNKKLNNNKIVEDLKNQVKGLTERVTLLEALCKANNLKHRSLAVNQEHLSSKMNQEHSEGEDLTDSEMDISYEELSFDPSILSPKEKGKEKIITFQPTKIVPLVDKDKAGRNFIFTAQPCKPDKITK